MNCVGRWAAIVTVLIWAFCVMPLSVMAQETDAIIYSDAILSDDGLTEVHIQIKNNPGILGFKLILDYDVSCVTVSEVKCGKLLTSGSFTANERTAHNQCLLLWNGIEECKDDGELAVLSVQKKGEGASTIDVSFSQPDTFNERWEDVQLVCRPIELGKTPKSTTGNLRNGTASSDHNNGAGEKTAISITKDVSNATGDYLLTPTSSESQLSVNSSEHKTQGTSSDDFRGSVTEEKSNRSFAAAPQDEQASSYSETNRQQSSSFSPWLVPFILIVGCIIIVSIAFSVYHIQQKSGGKSNDM